MLLMLALGAFIDSSQAADNITCYESCAAECDKKSPKCSAEVCLIWQYEDRSMFLIRDLRILMITRADLDRLSRLLELGRSESNFRGIFIMQFVLPRKVKKIFPKYCQLRMFNKCIVSVYTDFNSCFDHH